MNLKITDVRALKGDSAFLIDDGKTSVLYDTGFGFTAKEISENIKRELGSRTLDYIFLTHSHYDHALGSAYLREAFSNVKVAASEYAEYIFSKESARKLMTELDRKFSDKCGNKEYTDISGALQVDIPLKDLQKLRAGEMEFTALSLKGHTKCSMGFYLESEGLLLGSESLGVYVGEGAVVPSYLVSYKDSIDSIKRVMKLNPRRILVPHYGVIEADEVKLYLSEALKSAESVAEDVREIFLRGGTKEEAVEYFVNRFYSEKVKEIYPYDAMMLNTGITVDLLYKELIS